jgi:hypothetical protein
MQTARCDVLGCECGCHRQKIRRTGVKWTPERDAFVADALNRGRPVAFIASGLGVTEEAVRWRIKRLGRSTREGWRSRQEVVAALGVSRRAVDRWMRVGLLRVTKHGTRWTRINDADLEAFVRDGAGRLFEPADVRDAHLRRLAETSALVNRRRIAS